MTKVQSAQNIISQALQLAKRPVVCCSFGKDSLSLLAMVQDEYPGIDVLFLPEIEMHHKNLHAYQAAVRMNVCKLYSYPATLLDYVQKEDYFECFKYHYVDGKSWYVLYNGCRQYLEGESYLCAKEDLLSPHNLIDQYAFPWDCVFHGQKNADAVHFIDNYEFPHPIMPFGKGIIVMPLHNWTDEESLTYASMRELPIQKKRYIDNPSGLSTGKLNQDLISSDVIPVCFKCLDYREEKTKIVCPKTQKPVSFCGRSQEIHEGTFKRMYHLSHCKEV